MFALTERLTGVRVTDELLAEAEFRTGDVPEEPAGSWESVTVDIADAQGGRTFVQLRRINSDTRRPRPCARAEHPHPQRQSDVHPRFFVHLAVRRGQYLPRS
ncbi:hypothetical protein E4K10_39895 [Streptomyces sp. T1317-0309]|nr:hypothetical protein E4K10_39895 [Streptomyces sp. T1317-0309]